jgi:ArsR family transcriptional regulator
MNLRVPSIRHDDCDELAALCKAGGDPLRLNVLRALANDSFGVLELAQIFGIGQSGMSHHLKVLAQADLVATRREGNAIFYRRALPHRTAGRQAARSLLEEVDNLPAADVQARITWSTAAGRRQPGLFSRVGEIPRPAGPDRRPAAVPRQRAGAARQTELRPGATAIEVGPGDGGFLPDLARASPRSPRWTTARRCSSWRARLRARGAGNVTCSWPMH